MYQKNAKRSIITAGISLLILVLVIGGVIFVSSLNDAEDPYVQQQTSDDTSSADEKSPSDTSLKETVNDQASKPSDTTAPEDTPDPSTVNTIDITPMAISVPYVKGIGAFEYEVKRAANGTRYVEFRSPSLIGTKCTDDEGTFASILAEPTTDEKTTLAKTTKAGDKTYGLSLAETTCTSDAAALRNYQQSFSNAFSLLKTIE